MPSDLHCHSIHSDGSTSVKRLMELAAIRGLSAISLTDHDTFSGFEEAVYYGEKDIKGNHSIRYTFLTKQGIHYEYFTKAIELKVIDVEPKN